MKLKNGLETFPDDFLVNPDFYLYDLDFQENKARFVLMNRECYRDSPFLDSRVIRVDQDIYSIDLTILLDISDSTPTVPRPVNYVFHHGACGSTLLARCLDIKGASLVLREPIALHQLAGAKRHINNSSGREIKSWRRLRDLVLRFLTRTYDDHEVAMIKPSDWCNNLIQEVLGMHEKSSALLVYRDLRSFLLSTLKTKEGRDWMKACLQRALHDLSDMNQLPGIDPTRLADSEITTCVWVAEMYGFLRLLNNDSLQIKSLHGDKFMKDPLASLAGITEFFHMNIDRSTLKTIIDGPAFHSDSKRSWMAFDKEAHSVHKKALAEKLDDEINQGLSYMTGITRDNPIPEKLPFGM